MGFTVSDLRMVSLLFQITSLSSSPNSFPGAKLESDQVLKLIPQWSRSVRSVLYILPFFYLYNIMSPPLDKRFLLLSSLISLSLLLYPSLNHPYFLARKFLKMSLSAFQDSIVIDFTLLFKVICIM